VVGRYAGSEILYYDSKAFDETWLATGAIRGTPNKPRIESKIDLEGKMVRIGYRNPASRSTLEVFRNYEQELTASGFEVLFSCKNKACGGRPFNHNVVPYKNGFSENYGDQRYLAAKLEREEGDLYVAVYVCLNGSRAHTWVDVVEVAAMATGQVEVDAAKMLAGIEQKGSVALYGITFAFGKADILPSSEPTLDEVAQLLKANAELELHVVGHTDNVGGLASNLELSQRRAQSVVTALGQRGIGKERLEPHGLAFLAPVATNRTDKGRAENRRVVLLKQ